MSNQRWNKAAGILERRCTRCGEWMPATTEFFVKSSRGGIRSRCKKCARELAAEWRAANPDYHRQWVKDNPGKMAEYSAVYRERHAEELKERERLRRAKKAAHVTAIRQRYRDKNRDALVEGQALYRLENRDRANESARRWREEHAGITPEIRRRAGEYYKAFVTRDGGKTAAGKIIGRLENGLWVVRLFDAIKVGRDFQRIVHLREVQVFAGSVGVHDYDPDRWR